MCLHCTADVAKTGAYLDRITKAEMARRAKEPDKTNAEHTIRLTNYILDTISESDDQVGAVKNVALGLAVCMTRLIAAQEIHGVSFS